MTFEIIIYHIIIAILIFVIYMAVRKIKWQEKRIDVLECGVDALERIELSEPSIDIEHDDIITGESSGAMAKIVKAGSKGTLSIK